MNIARVFPRRTEATPTDDLAFVGPPPLMLPPIEAVHVSVAFTWDEPEARRLATAWAHAQIAPVKLGGPGLGMRGEEFMPGRYLKPGNVITSRGCPNCCWFCDVWRRDGGLRELPIREGWNVRDDNLLACSEPHIRGVFAMLKRQPQRSIFSGGLEAARMQHWIAEALAGLRPARVYFAYDQERDYEPLREAARMMVAAGFKPNHGVLNCYVLIGQPRDTMAAAERRLRAAGELGMMPFAMLYRNHEGRTEPSWRRFQRQWARPAITRALLRDAEMAIQRIQRETGGLF